MKVPFFNKSRKEDDMGNKEKKEKAKAKEETEKKEEAAAPVENEAVESEGDEDKPEAKEKKEVAHCPTCKNSKGSLCRTGQPGKAYTEQKPASCGRYEKAN
jgi:hypothetical protein